ncbi:MAG: hypothetical protein PSV16_03475 [Flavobacterium sp.]|nr:hypothetical protein [Flavobacterium sp.]
MDTSVTIIGVVFMALIGIPLYFVMRGQSINKKRIKTILAGYNHYRFHISEKQNRKVLLLDSEKKAFLLINFNHKPETVSFVNLNEVISSELEITTEGKDNSIATIAFAFQKENSPQKKTALFYSSENDQVGQIQLNEDFRLAQKWQKLLSDCLTL